MLNILLMHLITAFLAKKADLSGRQVKFHALNICSLETEVFLLLEYRGIIVSL